jgi:hypothetical protein
MTCLSKGVLKNNIALNKFAQLKIPIKSDFIDYSVLSPSRT